ncbi:hypothetical protein R6Q57_011679 [Mikania cordata]
MAEFNSFNKEESQQRFRLREEKLRVLQEALDEQQKTVDLKFMMKDHTIYQEPMLQMILDRKREIDARWDDIALSRFENGESGKKKDDTVQSGEK